MRFQYFADTVRVAKAFVRQALRFGVWVASLLELRRPRLEMKTQFLIDFAFDVCSEEPEIPSPTGLHVSGSRQRRRSAQYARDGAGVARPRSRLAPEVRAARGRQRVELRAAIVLRESPV